MLEESAKIILSIQRAFLSGFSVDFWIFFSNFGIFLGIVVFLVLYICIDRQLGASVFYSISFSLFFASLFKLVLREPRPFIRDSRIRNLDPHTSKGYSFPSAHCSFYTAFNTCLLYRYRAKVIFIPFFAFNVLIFLSRMVLGAHYLHDCIAGVILGIAVGLFSAFFYQNYRLILQHRSMIACIVALSVIFLLDAVLGILEIRKSNDVFYCLEGILSFMIGDNLERKNISISCASRVLKKVIRFLFFIFTIAVIELMFYPFITASEIFISANITFLGFYVSYLFTILARKLNLFENNTKVQG